MQIGSAKEVVPISYKYDQVYRNLKERIQSQIFRPNSFMPPENTLTTEFDVSRITIRKALSKLVDEGYLVSVPGKGYSVLATSNDKFHISLNPSTLLQGNHSRVKLLGSDIMKPTIDLVYHLRVHPDSRIVNIRWGLYKDNTPIAYDVHYIPYFSGINIWNDDFSYSSIGEMVRNQSSLDVTHEEIEITAIKCNEDVAEKLEIRTGAPVLLITKKIFADDEAIGMGEFYIRREYCRITGTTSNN